MQYPIYSFAGLVVYGSSQGNGGVRATIQVAIAEGPSNSSTAYLHFCDANVPNDTAGPLAGSNWDFYFPIGLLSTVLSIVRSEPQRFVELGNTKPGGNGSPLGLVGIAV